MNKRKLFIESAICLVILPLLILVLVCAMTKPKESSIPTEATINAEASTVADSTQLTIPETAPDIPTQPAQTLPPDAPNPLEEILDAMTVEEKVGQLFLARCPDSNAIADIQTYHLGGYVLFARDFAEETPDSALETINLYQQTAKIPMLIAVDEEGGTVTRVSRYPAFRHEKFPSPRYLYNQGGMDLLLSTEREKCQLLRSIGINVNLAPVCDISTDPDAFMYNRSLGLSPEATGDAIAEMVLIAEQEGIGAVLKHFPGYGNNSDTHVQIAVDNRTLEELETADLVPFRKGIAAGCDAIMVSHVYITAIDPDIPATLSQAVHDYLRQDMNFSGVIITDDLSMAAITELYGTGEAAILAVLAGNDLLCSTEYEIQYAAVMQAIQDGRIPMELLDEAVMRILIWKSELGLLIMES